MSKFIKGLRRALRNDTRYWWGCATAFAICHRYGVAGFCVAVAAVGVLWGEA